MNKFQFQISIRRFTLTLLSLTLFISTTENAYGELTYRDKNNNIVSKGKEPNKFPIVTCGRGEATDREFKGSVTDSAGNMFSLFCINKAYFEGIVKTIDAPLSNPFGRCVFDGGLNVFNFEVDEKNLFKQIEWINVKPKAGLPNDEIFKGIDNRKGEETDKWLPNARKYIKDNNLGGRVYTEDFFFSSPGSVQIASALDQEISSYENGELISLDVLWHRTS